MEYRKDSTGYHFYKIISDECVLHVSVFDKDTTIETKYDDFETTSTFKSGDCCINNITNHIDMVLNKTEECTQELFDNKLKQAIFNLDIYEYTKIK